MDFHNKMILAPMVKIGTLPMRLLALDYGADLVYCEELIDWKLLKCKRIVNAALGTVDYVDKADGNVVFQTCDREKKQLIFQIGTCSAERALQVAKLVEDDVAGIDVNMGCPKEFSLKGGMGAALLSQPDKIQSILTTLVQNTKIPVTCKIRILPELEKTLNLCKLIEKCGVKAIAIHGRNRDERPRHANHNDIISIVASQLKVPVIANGGSREICSHEDIWKFQKETGAASVMIARAAEWNCSIFRKEGKLPLDNVIKAYLRYAVDCNGAFSNTKYCVQNMLRELQETPLGKRFLESQTMEQLCSLWDLDDYLREKQEAYRSKQENMSKMDHCLPPPSKGVKRSWYDGQEYMEMEYKFVRNHFCDYDLPKTTLLMWTRKREIKQPVYQTTQQEKLFQCVVHVDGKRYTSSHWEKNKRYAEQGSAMVCLHSLGLLPLKENGWREKDPN